MRCALLRIVTCRVTESGMDGLVNTEHEAHNRDNGRLLRLYLIYSTLQYAQVPGRSIAAPQ